MLTVLLIVALSYLSGSIPASVWIGYLKGVDVRAHGSGNAGATNVYRVMGLKYAILVTAIDMGKGAFAAGYVATLRLEELPVEAFFGWQTSAVLGLVATVMAVIGHLYPIFAGFKGGKGANTATGALLAVSPISMGLTLVVFVLIAYTTKYISLASMLGATSYPIISAIRRYIFDVQSVDNSMIVFGVIIAATLVLAHRSNIQRLLDGTESKIGSKKTAPVDSAEEEI